MATITKKKALSNFQGADVAKTDTQANAGLIPSTPKIDTTSVIKSQIQPTASDIFKQKYQNQGIPQVIPKVETPAITAPATPLASTPSATPTQITNTDDLYKNPVPAAQTQTTSVSGPTNQQNADMLAKGAATIAENAQKESEKMRGDLKYGAQQRDYQQESLLSSTKASEQRANRQMDDTTKQISRAIDDTERISKRNIEMVEKTAALQGTGKSSGFTQGLANLKEDTIRTVDRLREDLMDASKATGEEAKVLWETYNRNKAKIDNDFEYQFRDFTNRQAASIAELTSAGYSPEKMNKAIDKIYEQAQFKTSELFTNYINNYQTLNSETRLQAQEVRTQEEFKTAQQKDFISQYIGYDGERLGSQTMQSLKSYLDNGQISQNDYDLYTEMLQNNTIETLQQYGVVQQGDLDSISQLLNKGYSPTEAIAFMIQSNPDRFKTQQDYKAPNIQIIGQDADGNDIRGYFDPQTQQLVPISTGGAGTGGATGDLRYLAGQYPGQAWAKNNNPGGMTWGVSQGLKDAWTAAGIEFGQGTPRPAGEGNSYISFNTIEDGLAAQWIALSRGGGDINARLQKWVGTGEGPNYAKQVMGWAGIPNGTKFTDLTEEQAQALQSAVIRKESPGLYKLMQSQAPQDQGGDFDQTDILVFNAMTPSDKKKSQNNPLYNKFVNEKTKVMTSKDAPISEIMKYSMGGSKMNQTQETQLSKYAQGVDQLDGIQQSLKSSLTGPVLGRIRSMNPYDTNAQTIKAQLTALVPTIARGAYGEVGVLTDADVELYKKTIPNLTSTNDLNDALLAFTLKSLGQGYKTKLRSIAGGGFDVSGYGGEYDRLVGLADSLLEGKTPNTNIPASLANPVASKPSSQANADYLSSLGITQ